MRLRHSAFFLVVAALPSAGVAKPLPRPAEVVRIWPGVPPGTGDWKAPEEEADVTLPSVGKIHVITNVSVPTLTIVRPAPGRASGAAMVVLPGGSFRALAWDVDGLETARWLAAHGITAFVLKYRVRPPQPGESFGDTLEDFAKATAGKRAFVVADAGQAIRYVRAHAKDYGLAIAKVGMIGFSAGAMATVEAALANEPDARPNIAVAMYGAALTRQAPGPEAPPLFVGAAEDDPELPAANSAELFARWAKAGRPAELHIYEKGGHGFGFRRHGTTSDHWPQDLRAWLSAQGFLAKAL